jgi:DNA-directed RNA polymerase subunit beta'
MKEVTKVSKVQSFILNSVQSVYQSQGVTINDKHLEVIIKQMTTKVLITHEGNTPLLRRELIYIILSTLMKS